MHPSRLFAAGGLLAFVGLVLLVFEVVRTLASNSLGTVGTVLLWAGVGLLAVGAALLVLAVVRTDADTDTESDADTESEPVEPASA